MKSLGQSIEINFVDFDTIWVLETVLMAWVGGWRLPFALRFISVWRVWGVINFVKDLHFQLMRYFSVAKEGCRISNVFHLFLRTFLEHCYVL